jgi:hypothetical protein
VSKNQGKWNDPRVADDSMWFDRSLIQMNLMKVIGKHGMMIVQDFNIAREFN